MNTPIKIELAKLLKEKGFEQNPMKHINQATMNGTLVFPTIAEVVMWLYEKYGIWISVFKYKDHAADVNDPWLFRNQFDRGEYLSPTEAYEVGIRYALDNLIREEKK